MSNPFPENWSEALIGEVVALAGDRADPSQANGVPFLGLEHIEAHTTRILEPGDAVDMKSSSPRFKSGDVLYSRLRPYLNKVCVPDFDGLCSGEIYVLRPESGIVSDFLKFRINSFDFVDFAKHLDNGDRPRVKYDEVSQFRFGLPPSKEQQRILSVLDDTLAKIDEAEEALDRVKRNLDRYRASVLKAACEGRLVPTEADLARQQGRDYEPASQLLKRILIARREAWEKAQLEAYTKKDKTPPKDWKSRYPEPQDPDTSDLPELPEGWCWASVDMLCNQVTDGEHNQPPYQSEGLPMLSAKHVRDGFVTDDSAPLISAKAFEKARARCAPETGDILIVSVGATTGRTAIVGDFPAFALVRSVLLLKPILVGRFLFNWLRAPYSQNFIRLASGSTAQAHLYIGDTKKIPVPLPPADRVEDISAILDQTLTVITNLQKQVTHLTRKSALLRQSLLKHAFSGKLVPQDSADEPASVLLDRIRAQRRELEGGTTPRKRAVRKTKKSS